MCWLQCERVVVKENTHCIMDLVIIPLYFLIYIDMDTMSKMGKSVKRWQTILFTSQVTV